MKKKHRRKIRMYNSVAVTIDTLLFHFGAFRNRKEKLAFLASAQISFYRHCTWRHIAKPSPPHRFLLLSASFALRRISRSYVYR